MLVFYFKAAQSAIPVQDGGVETKQVALSINVLMWHYSGLYPPPFRLGFHTGRGCAVGITLNKHSHTITTLLCLTVFFFCFLYIYIYIPFFVFSPVTEIQLHHMITKVVSNTDIEDIFQLTKPQPCHPF